MDPEGEGPLVIVGGQLQLDLGGFIGLTNWLDVSAGLPIVVLQPGDPAGAVLGPREEATGAGISDVRIAVRGQALGPDQLSCTP